MRKIKGISVVLVVIALFSAVFPPFIQARSSLMWGENDRRTRNVGISIPTNYKQIAGSPIHFGNDLKASYASPTVIETTDGRTVMFIKDSEHEKVYAIDLANPSSYLWKSVIKNTQGQPSTPMYYGKTKENPDHSGFNSKDVVFVASGDYMYALDAWTGYKIGQGDIGEISDSNRVGSHPLVLNNKLYIGSSNGHFYGWDLSQNMQTIFNLNLNSGWISGAPTKVGDKIVVGTDSSPGKVFVIDQSGSILHTYKTLAGVTGAAIALGTTQFFIKDKLGNAYIGDRIGNFGLINGDLGTGRNKGLNPPALGGDGYVYFTVNYDSNDHGHIYGVGVNAGNKGKLIHLYEANNPIVSAPTVTNEAIFFAESRGKIIAIEKRTGKPFKWLAKGGSQDQTSGTQLFSSITIAGGKHHYITIATDDGINVFAPDMPNLTITDFTPSNGNYNVGQAANYAVKIKNNGPSNTVGAFKIRIYKNSIAASNTLGETSVTDLAANQSKTVNVSFSFPDPGDFKLIAYVDADRQIDETDESIEDNTSNAIASVKRVVLPGQVFADFTIQPNPANVNQPFSFKDLSSVNGDTISGREWSTTINGSAYKWTTDSNGSVLTGIRPNKVSEVGTYPVTLSVRTTGGKTSTKMKNLQITNTPPEEKDTGIPPNADFDLVTPIWTDDLVDAQDKSIDEDGEIISSAWVYTQDRFEDNWTRGLPPTDKPGVFTIRRYVMDNDFNVAYKDKNLEVIEKVATTDLIPGNEYAYPAETQTPFPYEADISDTDTQDLTYLLPAGFPIWDYEVRANEQKMLLFKKDDYRVWEVKDKQVVEVTPSGFYQPNNKKLVIKDIQLVGDSVLISGFYLYWGHYYTWGADGWFNNDGTLIRYTPEANTKPNLVMDFIGLESAKWGYYGDSVSLGVGIRNYSLVGASGTIKLKVTPYGYSYDRYKGGYYYEASSCYYDYNYRYVCQPAAQTKTITINLPPMGTAYYKFDFYGNYGYYTADIDTENALSELSEADNSSYTNGGIFAEADPWRSGNTGERGVSENLPLSYYPDYMTYRQYDETISYRYEKKMYDITVPPITEKSKDLLIELDENLTKIHESVLKESRETKNIQIRRFNNNKAIVAFDYKDQTDKIPDGRSYKGTILTGIYDTSTHSYSEIDALKRKGVIEVSALLPVSYSSTVWQEFFKTSGGSIGLHFTSSGTSAPFDAELLDFKFDGENGWYLARVKDRYYQGDYYSIKTNGNFYDRMEGDSLVAIRIKYDKISGQFSFDTFKQSGSQGTNWPHPYKYRERIVSSYNNGLNEILPNRNGYVSFAKNLYSIIDAKESAVDKGSYDVFSGLGYMVAHAVDLLPSQLGSLKYITGIGANDYSLIYLQNSNTGKYYLLAYDGLSIKEYKIQGFPSEAIITKMSSIQYNGTSYVLVQGALSGQPILYLFAPPAKLFNIPSYFATNMNYHLPIGVHLFHNEFVNQADVISKLKDSNYTVSITQKLFDGAAKVFDSFNLSTQPTSLSRSSKGSTYLNFYRPFNSPIEAEYEVQFHVNPKQTITEQNYLKQPLYGNNVASSKFITIDNRKPTLVMSRTKLYKDRNAAQKSAIVSWRIFQTSYSFQKYNVFMRNKVTGNTKLLASSGYLNSPGSLSYTNELDDPGSYEMFIEVFTKYNQILRSDPVDFTILTSSPPKAEIYEPSSADSLSPTIINSLRPTIKWSYFDADGDPQTAVYLYIVHAATGQYVTYKYLSPYSAKQWTLDKDLVDNEAYYVYIVPYDAYKSGSVSAKKYFEIIANHPPIADFSWTPAFPWEGDTVQILNRSTDADGDTLASQWLITDPAGRSMSFTTKDLTLTKVLPGKYSVRLTVTDTKGASQSIRRTVDVAPLTLTPYVYHTDAWRMKHEELGHEVNRDPKDFYSGEKILVSTIASSAPIVEVKAWIDAVGKDGRRTYVESVLSLATPSVYKGALFDNRLLDVNSRLPDGLYLVHFQVTYMNGTVKREDIPINIIGTVYEVPKVHRIH